MRMRDGVGFMIGRALAGLRIRQRTASSSSIAVFPRWLPWGYLPALPLQPPRWRRTAQATPTRSALRAPWWLIRGSIAWSAPCNTRETLPLADHEVVLTFDDGPLPRNSNQILEILASQCVKATFFTIGRMAQSFPESVRKLRDAGHTIGTHTQNHPLNMNSMPIERAGRKSTTALPR